MVTKSTHQSKPRLQPQTAIIGALVLFFGRSIKEAVLFTVSYLAVCIILMGGYTSVDILWSLQALNVPIICVSKVSVFVKMSHIMVAVDGVWIGEWI
jgi:hypothetical protein